MSVPQWIRNIVDVGHFTGFRITECLALVAIAVLTNLPESCEAWAKPAAAGLLALTGYIVAWRKGEAREEVNDG